ncbi:trypsin-like peptidase domain-containing protein [Terribacillus sp. 7520-G]|uniref:S1C family serine protease n=1 Tax=unclassified Terribacillus TaxID=2636508 RepID=UPI001E34A834|nr:trypsin-like peptidase domain-containing protein [Terribacillus sp. 7520-G]
MNRENDNQYNEHPEGWQHDTNEQEPAYMDDQHKDAESIEETPPKYRQAIQVEEPIKEQQPPKQKGKVWTGFVSGIAGGILVLAIVAILVFTNVISFGSNTASPSTMGTNNTSTTESSNKTLATQTSTQNLTSAIQDASAAVVGVENLQQTDLFSESEEAGSGSGVIYKKENGKAYIVTNNHVVDGATSLEVTLANGEKAKATLLGTDQISDLAVLEIDGANVDTVATFGTSDDLTVGQQAIAIGNPLGAEFAGSVTQGIISGLDRSVAVDSNNDGTEDWVTEVLQTDAAINPGNSGGALINANGEVIGINSMKIAQEEVEGIGFAIPIDAAKPIINQLEKSGKVERPYVGIGAVSLDQVPQVNAQQTLNLPEGVTQGVVLAQVVENSPAADAGLQQYDVITKIDDQDITSMVDLRSYLYSDKKIGDKVTVTYYRDGKKETTKLTLAKDQTAQSEQSTQQQQQ